MPAVAQRTCHQSVKNHFQQRGSACAPSTEQWASEKTTLGLLGIILQVIKAKLKNNGGQWLELSTASGLSPFQFTIIDQINQALNNKNSPS